MFFTYLNYNHRFIKIFPNANARVLHSLELQIHVYVYMYIYTYIHTRILDITCFIRIQLGDGFSTSKLGWYS